MTEDDLAFLRPDLEVAEPDALIDQRQKLMRLNALGLAGLEVEGQAQLQAVGLRPPGEPQLVVLPVAGQGEGEIPVLGAVEFQILSRQHVLNHVQRVETIFAVFGLARVHGVYGSLWAEASPRWCSLAESVR